MENTPMGTPRDIFWQHMDFLRPGDVVCFDDGFRGIWDEREEFKKRCIVPKVFIAPRLVGEKGYLAWNEIRTLQNDCGFDFQCHSWSHQTLVGPMIDESPKSERTEAWYRHELVDSKAKIEQETGHPCAELCFPVGYFSDALLERCRAAGYAKVYASYPGNRTDDYVQPRCLVQGLNARAFKAVLNGGMNILRSRYLRRQKCRES